MNAIDRLALNWQFESFTTEYQNSCYQQMLYDFTKAWSFKRNRSYIQMRLDQLDKCRPDLYLIERFCTNLYDEDPYGYLDKSFLEDWSKYDIRKTKKEPYIGPETYLQM